MRVMHSQSLLAAALDFFGPIVPDSAQTCAAGWGSAIALLNNIIKFALSAGITIAVLMIAYAGFLWVTNPINAENRTKARSVLMNAGIGLLIALGAWLIVNTLLGALSGGSANISSFTGFISGGDTCIIAKNQTPGPVGESTNTSNLPLSSTGTGACNGTTVQQADPSLTTSQANTFACIAQFESSCGTKNQNYNWNGAQDSSNPSTAYGTMQVTLKGNSDCYDNSICEQAAGVSGSLNCKSAFDSHGNAIIGRTLSNCQIAATNIGCSAAAAACVVAKQGYQAAYGTDAKAMQCVSKYGG